MISAEIKTMLSKGDYEQSLALIENKIGEDKNNSELYVLKGNIYARLEKTNQALEAFDMALKVNKGEIGAYNGKALVHFCLKENEKGMDQIKKGIIVANFLDKNPNSSNESISVYLEEALKSPKELNNLESIKPLASAKTALTERKTEVKPIKSLTSIKESIAERKIEIKQKNIPSFCSQCGVEFRSGSKFCPKCGAKIKLR